MKFAKELEQDLVPEWRIKYLNYKAGKKYVKAVSRAINRANGTPTLRRPGDLPPRRTPSFFSGSPFTPGRWNGASPNAPDDVDPLRESPAPLGRAALSRAKSPAKAIPIVGERQGLTEGSGSDTHYGSFVPTPPSRTPPSRTTPPPPTAASRHTFELPAPAIRVPSNLSEPAPKRPALTPQASLSRQALQRSTSMAPAIPDSRSPATVASKASPSALRRLLSFSNAPPGRTQPAVDIDMRALDEVRERECDFFAFLDSELEKVESFYRLKEEQAGERLTILRDQLHEMRNRRTQEIQDAKKKKRRSHEAAAASNTAGPQSLSDDKHPPQGWIDKAKARVFKPGPNSKALQRMPRTPRLAGEAANGNRDYSRRPQDQDVSYRTAKRKLKLALHEFYRGLELLKAYALLNRTAFRKLNKKYDKAVNARPPYRYMNEKVNKSWFVNSAVLDSHIQAVEDLYARYFERGNHKIAAGKLRNLAKPHQDESGSAFRNGLMIGIGVVFAVQGAVQGARLLFDVDLVVRQQTSYLMQIYGGYFLMLYLFILFCLDCRIWTINKINYPFIFEFEPRSQLDWRQLSQFPSFFVLLFGVSIWINFSRFGSPTMYLYYPVILIAVTAIVLFFPAPVLWYRSRRWFLYSHWRLLLAGLYPVEFRDFFLGDIYCSLTYAVCNVELFFCVYARTWQDPEQCNSNHSRLLGFFATLPPIWRALQCIRRYSDTKNVFPHLVNCGKYSMTILSLVALSLYRIDGTHFNLALFIAFAAINAVYCSIWDLFMDFSLIQTQSRHFLLRDIIAIKQRWVYYAVLVVDPILRFAWIFYAIFTHDTQHSTIVSFLVSFAEVTRRGMWTIFRVENEHCANVAQYKASRDTPLPYDLDTFPHPVPSEFPGLAEQDSASTARSTGVDAAPSAAIARLTPSITAGSAAARHDDTAAAAAEEGTPPGTVRRRRADTLGKRSISVILAEAHKQDFEKKRKPPRSPEQRPLEEEEEIPSSDEEEEEDDEDDGESRSMLEEQMDVGEVEEIIQRDEAGE